MEKQGIQQAQAAATGHRLHIAVVGLLCLALGLFIGMALQASFVAGDALDEEQLRAIIRGVLQEQGPVAAESGPDRFELVDDDPFLGDSDAPVVIVEFSDFFCTFCKRHFEMTFAPLLENYGRQIRYVYRDFARLTEESAPAAVAAHCAHEQGKFWDFHGEFFAKQSELGQDFYLQTAEKYELDMEAYRACLSADDAHSEVELDGLDGQLAGVRGTPAFFINGQILSGAQPYSIFERMTQRALERAGVAPSP